MIRHAVCTKHLSGLTALLKTIFDKQLAAFGQLQNILGSLNPAKSKGVGLNSIWFIWFGSFDLAMVTIKTYGNKKYGVNNHITPEEAVTIGKEINAKALLGIHWGTIDLYDEDPWEPPKRFEEAAKKSGYSHEDIWIFKIGETRKLPGY